MSSVVILASGNGSNAEAIIRYAQSSKSFKVLAVISDVAEALVLPRSEKLGIKTFLKEKTTSKASYFKDLAALIESLNPDLIVLAGFMKILPQDFLNHFYDKRLNRFKVVNIHPTLLPDFKGANGYADVFNSDIKITGCTVHFVDAGVDTGEIIHQEKYERIYGETLADLKSRGLKVENQIYPVVIEKILKTYFKDSLI